MKRFAITLIAVMLVSVGLSAQSQPVLLIDFDKLKADSNGDNTATLTDFRSAAGNSYTDAELNAMVTSLAIGKWEVVLNSSARSVANQSASKTAEAVVQSTSKYKDTAGKTVLGIRALFPTDTINSYVEVKPPFEIPAYADKDARGADGKFTIAPENKTKNDKFEGGFGVVKNVGVLKSIKVNVYGLNFPEKLTILLKDQFGKIQEYYLGTFNFDGWRELVWDNPNYISDVRNRDIVSYPLYPQSEPALKLIGFRVYKDASIAGGDFVGYIKDVYITFDKAQVETPNARDINSENVWGILQQRETERKNAEQKALGALQVQRYLEQQKLADQPAPATAPATTTK